MIKKDLTNRIAESLEIEEPQAMKAVEIVMDSIKEAISKNDTVELRGFGTFSLARRKAKLCRDIGRNKGIQMPAYNKPVFKPSRKFINECNDVV